jgi:hypothetical protein
MAKCAYCKTETELHENGTPICLGCAGAKNGGSKKPSGDSQTQLQLIEEIRLATDRVNAAAESFTLILQDIPSKLPVPDSTARIVLASRELAAARSDLMRAHRKLNQYFGRGVVSNDPSAH